MSASSPADNGHDEATAKIRANRSTLETMLDKAERAFRRGRLDECAATLQAAGYHAWRNHPGIYFSARLETLAARLGGSVTRAQPLVKNPGVLHVLTEASQVGGHTRLAWRWIRNDTSSRHTVVLTNQRGVHVPDDLSSAPAHSGGHLVDLSPLRHGLMVRASELAALADAAALVVVHAHPHDVVPLLALTGTSTPVAFVNHADHVYWSGGSAADVLVNLRDSSRRLSTDHRDFLPEDNLLLPLPLDPVAADEPRQGLRESLDVPEGVPLAITIASPYKFNAPHGIHYLTLHERLLDRHPDLHLRVAGPRNEGVWAEASTRTDGRLRAVGPVHDIAALYAAADLYVDSFPMGSLTSLLDAATRGVPVISFSAIETPHVMTSDDPALSDFPVFFSDQDAYLQQAHALLTDLEAGRMLGQRMAQKVALLHTDRWTKDLERVYAALRERAAERTTPRQFTQSPNADSNPRPVQELLLQVHDGSGMAVPAWRAWMLQGPQVPVGTRVAWLRLVPLRSLPSALVLLVPDVLMARLRPRLRGLGRRLRAIRPGSAR